MGKRSARGQVSKEGIAALKARLVQEDLSFAERLHSLQDSSFPTRLRSIGEWAEAEKVKRLILGLHESKTEQSGQFQHTVVHKIINSRADDASH